MHTWNAFVSVGLVLAGSTTMLAADPTSIDTEVDELASGLVARYQSLGDRSATLTRIEPKPAFHLGESSPHPRLPAGPFEATWSGVLLVQDPAPITFSAFLSGEATVIVDGVTVLDGRGESATAWVEGKTPLQRERGAYRFTVRYRSLAQLPARLQVWWHGPSFSREPLPAWWLKHLPADEPRELAEEQEREQGRQVVAGLGCARCHPAAFPAMHEPPPGPSLADAAKRVDRAWLRAWLADPARVRPGARMPQLFTPDRTGYVERWLVAEQLGLAPDPNRSTESGGDHRAGRLQFATLGCAACHFLPDADPSTQADLGRTPLTGLRERFTPETLAGFIENPHARYPDGRMPKLVARTIRAHDLMAFLWLWSPPRKTAQTESDPPTRAEIQSLVQRLGVRDEKAAGAALVREKRCAACHPGLEPAEVAPVPLTRSGDAVGCLSEKSLPRFNLDAAARKKLTAYRAVAGRERHPSPFAEGQRLLGRVGCVRCHQRDSDRPPPIETAGSTLGGSGLQYVPFQRTPRLTYPHQKYLRSHLVAALRDGVSGLRPSRYSYRMPAFGDDAPKLARALAEADGELPDAADPPDAKPADSTLGPNHGPGLIGFQGYACVSCHQWNGTLLADPDPGAVGADLTRVVDRIRRDWFDRYLEGPARAHPGTPMPAIFQKGKPALLTSVLDGDPQRQREALWSYLALGKQAPGPKPPPPLVLETPTLEEPALVAQIPLRLPDGKKLETLTLLFPSHDLIVYDLSRAAPQVGYVGAQLVRGVQGRQRWFSLNGTPIETGFPADPAARRREGDKLQEPTERTLLGYDRLPDGVRVRWRLTFPFGDVEVNDTLRLRVKGNDRKLVREVTTGPSPAETALLLASGERALPPQLAPPAVTRIPPADSGKIEGVLERPGYRAIAYPRPKTATGEDRVMPGAIAADPKSGQVFITSMKTGELFVVRDPTDDGRSARFENYGRGLFEEALSMLGTPEGLYLLHRRNLTRIRDTRGSGTADRFDRIAALPQSIADTYDYAYGLARERDGAFILSYAPHSRPPTPGAGGVVRLVPGQPQVEIAHGLRNPIGWASGPDGAVYFTDNQGEWIATSKLCQVKPGRFYGYAAGVQQQHAGKTPGKAAVWVPYAWARSLNGLTFDTTGGKFGPFAGQVFLAELMFGGAIVRASLEEVKGERQGVCFPFWGPGLLGPLTLTFDPRGRLWVGGITEPGWMAQPDRGAVFRIDYTGEMPFEMETIRIRPRGFRIHFTRPIDPASARSLESYRIEHFRYELTGAYGSPELDRTRVRIERVAVAADGRSVEVTTAPLVADRVYQIHAGDVRSPKGESLVQPTGAYTVNAIPDE